MARPCAVLSSEVPLYCGGPGDGGKILSGRVHWGAVERCAVTLDVEETSLSSTLEDTKHFRRSP